MDPIMRLERKVRILEQQKQELEKELKRDENDISKLRELIDKKRTTVDTKNNQMVENKEKLQRATLIISESEKSLRKIIETSLALEKALDQEVPV